MLGPQDKQPEAKPVVKREDERGELGYPVEGELEKLHLARSLGVENLSDIEKYQDQLNRLVEWAKLKGAKSREDVVWQVRQLAARVGGPPIGNNNVQHLSRVAYLEMERMKIDEELKEYGGQ